MRTQVRFAAILAGLILGALCLAPAAAASQSSIQGVVYNASSGASVADARITLMGGGAQPSTTTSDVNGAFSFSGLNAGTYFLRTTAPLYQAAQSAPIVVGEGQTVDVSVALAPVSTANITTLGHVTVRGQRTLNTGSAAAVTITADTYTSTGNTQIQQLLESTPGVTIENFDNGAPGNVTTLTIRGTGGFVGGSNTGYEVLVLQDGEPIRNGEYGDDDLSSLTPAIYSRTEVVKGVGGTSIFGANTIGGTLNLVTIDPKATEGALASLLVGSYGTSDYDVLDTDTSGRLGYVFDYHGYNTQGYVPTQLLVDVPPFTFSSHATTPPVGSITNPTERMTLKSGLGKIRYSFGASSYAVVTFTDEADVRDQFGLLGDPETVFLSQTETSYSNDPLGYPYWFGYPDNFVQNTDPKYGIDYHAVLGGGALVLRYYTNWVNRWVDGNSAPPAECCFLQKSIDHLTGVIGTWEKSVGNNDLTLAAGGNGDSFVYGSCGDFSFSCSIDTEDGFPLNVKVTDADIATTNATQIEDTYLVRDEYQASDKLQVTGAAYYSDYSDLNVKRFDPRVALVDRPDQNSVIRLSAGTGFAAPRISDIVSPLVTNPFLTVSGPNCPASNQYCDATSGNRNIKSETGVGYDLGYERTWGQLGDASIDVYRTDLDNHIFDAILPASAALQSEGILGIEEPVNIAHSTYQGIEFSMAVPVTDMFAVRGYYNTQSAYPYGVSLQSEAIFNDVVNNQQYLGVPLHKAGYSLNFQNGRRWTAFMGGDWNGPNNSWNVSPFWVYNAGISAPFAQDTQLYFAWHNIFNKNAGIYSVFDGGVPYSGVFHNPETNAYYTAPYATSAYSYAPHGISLEIEQRWGSMRLP
jgi:outer membrane receptor for ferrienterochelin and colicin